MPSLDVSGQVHIELISTGMNFDGQTGLGRVVVLGRNHIRLFYLGVLPFLVWASASMRGRNQPHLHFTERNFGNDVGTIPSKGAFCRTAVIFRLNDDVSGKRLSLVSDLPSKACLGWIGGHLYGTARTATGETHRGDRAGQDKKQQTSPMLRRLPAIHDHLLLKIRSLLGERGRVSAPKEPPGARQHPRSPVTCAMSD
jgi:hypothetical protein